MKIKEWLKNKAHKVISWVREDKWRTAGVILWVYLFVRFQGVRDFFLGVLKFIVTLWISMISLVLAMVIFALVAFAFMLIGVKIGVLPKDYITVRISKRHKKEKEEVEN